MRSMKRVVSLILALCLLLGCAAADGIATPSDLVPPATQKPTQAPTTAPTATPTKAPTNVPVIEKGWDESACQHNTPECEQAPDCDIPGCQHITKDAHGLDVPACALGEWLLDAQDRNPVATISVRQNPIDLNVADATIYRSGSYHIKGGNLRPGASITVAKNRVVVLELEDVTLGTLVAEKGSLLYFRTEGANTLNTLTVQGENNVEFTTGGALTIKAISSYKPESKITFEVKGGSLLAPLTEEKEGRTANTFAAQGATSVTVAGQVYAAEPHADGNFYLWLSEPDAGMKWTSALNGQTLAITQTADVAKPSGSIKQGEANTLTAGTYELSGQVAAGTKLNISASGVTVVLNGATATGELISASSAYTLQIKGDNTIDSLTGSGAVTLQGDGKLTVNGTLPASVSFRSGRYVLANPPAAYTAYAVDSKLDAQTVTLDGAAYPLLMTADGKLLLPAPAKGKSYAIAVDAKTVTVSTVTGDAYALSSKNTKVNAGASKTFTVIGDGEFVTGSITAAGATASAAFQNVKLKGEKALLSLNNEKLTVSLTGDNTLQASSGDAITLAGSSSLVLSVTSGRLALRGQSSLKGMTLKGNILVEPVPSEAHLSLMIRDKNGNPVPNKELTVTIGGETYQYTTHYDGSLHLWGLGNISGQEIAATDGENVYTAVVMSNEAQLTTGLTDFSDVTFASQADGSLLISWAVPGAGSTGVQLLYGKTAVDMPDTYVAGAQHITGKDFSAKVTGIPAGSVVTVRAYATQASGAVLNEKTADGFQFGEIFTYVHRLPWKYNGEKGDADAVYTGKAYESKVEVPASATISYSGRDLVNGKPVYPGEYVMKVTIPEGDAKYLPGTVEIPFTIGKATITIKPGYNLQKYKYRNDPEFTWTASGLLQGDTVSGKLTRQQGEEVGEYAWLTSGFYYPMDYYEIRIDPNAAPFLILPLAPLGGILVNEVMHPVEQTIILQDGRKLTVVLTAQESLTVTHSVLGNLVRNELDEPRLFTPQLSWNPDTDEVLLMMRAEPEMSIDNGYQTDSMGNPIWGVRRMRLSGNGLEHIQRIGISALTLINKDASLTCRVEDFLSEEMLAAIKEVDKDATLSSAVFYLTVEPVQETPEAIRPVTDGWRMSAVMVLGKEEIDVTELLPNLTAAVDMEPVADLLKQMERYDEETFPAQFLLALEDGTALESTFVEPFEEDELEKAAFPTMMYINRYVAAPLTASGTVYAVNNPEAETEEEAADAAE